MIDRVPKNECCGCRACADACPVSAIRFSMDEKGFLYPCIDTAICIGCGKCERVCPILAKNSFSAPTEPKAYIGRVSDAEIRKKSTSGGIFYALGKAIIESGGVVFGAAFDDSFTVHHEGVNSLEDIPKLMGSKYAQSDTQGVYENVRSALQSGKRVLFSGTPCQTAALRTYLKKDYAGLYIAEVICHGIPAASLLASYIRLMEKRYRSKVTGFRFRDKSMGWHKSAVAVDFANGRHYIEPITVDAYMHGFLGGITIRENCYRCAFRGMRSGADFVLGDFWGAEAEMPEIDDNTGLSGIIVNTQKGDELIHGLGLALYPCETEKIIRYNRNIIEDTPRNPLRETFYKVANAKGEETAIRVLLWEKPYRRAIRLLRSQLRQIKRRLSGEKKALY